MATGLAKLRYYQIIGAAAGLCAIGSFMAFDMPRRVKIGIAVAWLILPPIFFFIELHWVRKHQPGELDACKLSQESASKIWAGVSAALALVLLDKS